MSETVLETAAGPVPQPSLTDQERTNLQRMLAFPLDLPPEFITYMEERMRLLLSADNIIGMAQRIATVGQIKIIAKDLTAQTGVYVWEDSQGAWLYANGATFTAADYAELNTFLGTNILPDTRGRSLWLCGTNAALDLFDNDGVTEASRQPAHTHSDSLAISAAAAGHTHGFNVNSGGPSTTSEVQSGLGSTVAGAGHQHGVSATTNGPSATTTTVSGSVGSGMAGSDAVAHIVIGSLLIKA